MSLIPCILHEWTLLAGVEGQPNAWLPPLGPLGLCYIFPHSSCVSLLRVFFFFHVGEELLSFSFFTDRKTKPRHLSPWPQYSVYSAALLWRISITVPVPRRRVMLCMSFSKLLASWRFFRELKSGEAIMFVIVFWAQAECQQACLLVVQYLCDWVFVLLHEKQLMCFLKTRNPRPRITLPLLLVLFALAAGLLPACVCVSKTKSFRPRMG